MAETKKKPAEKAKPAPREAAQTPAEQPAPVTATPPQKTNVKGLRVGAVLLWVLALACEVLTILIINGTLYIEPARLTAFLIGGIILDAVLVIIGAQLWKSANHKDPISNKNKTKFWLWNNMGVIAAVVCFFPLIIFLLKDKNLDAKTKKLASVVAVIALLIAGAASYDWNPVSAEDFEKSTQADVEAIGDGSGLVYWTRFGKSYHLDKNCQTLSRTTEDNLFSGSVEEAFEAKRTDPCDFCASGGEAKQAAAEADTTVQDTDADAQTDTPTDEAA